MLNRAQKLAVSNYGRDFGWFIEHEGKVLGELNEPRCAEQFWNSYSLIATSEKGKQLLFEPEMWDKCIFRYRNKELNEYAEYAFPGETTKESLSEGRINMRALYLTPNGLLEKIVFDIKVILNRKQ